MTGNSFYNIGDTARTISEIQKWLRALLRCGYNIPEVFIDGIYGPETRASVAAFQRTEGLPPTGKTDNLTFDRLYTAYTRCLERSADIYITNDIKYTYDIPVKKGEVSDTVYHLKLLIRSLAEFDEIFLLELNNVFDDNTELAVMKLQRLFGLTENGEVDNIFINRLSKFAKRPLY